MIEFVLRQIDVHVLRYPIARPVRTSFGMMADRPAVLVRVEDEIGHHGWGEAWCNFPSVGAEHRARLIADVLAPLAVDRPFDHPSALFEHLTRSTAVLALQSGERGPFAQTIAALDIATWDLAARRTGAPLWEYLGGTSPDIGVYASGLNPDDAFDLAAAQRIEGHRAFKLKVGFGSEVDKRSLEHLRKIIGDAPLALDANQAWTLSEAQAALPRLAAFAPLWLEEPLRCDRPWSEWQTLAKASNIPIAAGENLADAAAFDAALVSGAIEVFQPDLAKWGGFTSCLSVARRVVAAGKQFYPHFLGAGVGLVAAGHLLAAAGGNGWLEVDSNKNPLRECIAAPLATLKDGRIRLSDAPGLGIEPDLILLDRYRVAF